jgi:hypothetical protein
MTAAKPRPDGLAGLPVAKPSFAACQETHIGVVFFVGDRVYKAKKPVRTDFLDFTTRQARLTACRREVELNRRMAPDVYLGVADLTDPQTAGPADHLVVMRRLPAHRRLSTLVTFNEPVAQPLRELARQLAVLHARAERGPHISAEGSSTALARRWAANVERISRIGLRSPSPDEIAEVDRLSRRFIDGRAALFENRCTSGRIVDGHGDLIADDVFCLPDGPRALDCLEFDDRLRYLDGLDDAAFLAMDLDRLGRPDLAERFLDDYAEFAGDPAPASLRHHYIAYRAWVRALVACVRSEQGEPTSAEPYTALALRHLRAGAVRLVLVGGLPASGKSTLASLLADRTGAVLVSSDRTRKDLAGLPADTPAAAPYRQGLYSPAMTEQVYSELLDRARLALGAGEHVILDASWTDPNHREWAADLAEQTHTELVELRCDAPRDVRTRRLVARGPGPSDATVAVAAAMADNASPWPSATGIDTSTTQQDCLAAALASWQAATERRSEDR